MVVSMYLNKAWLWRSSYSTSIPFATLVFLHEKVLDNTGTNTFSATIQIYAETQLTHIGLTRAGVMEHKAAQREEKLSKLELVATC